MFIFVCNMVVCVCFIVFFYLNHPAVMFFALDLAFIIVLFCHSSPQPFTRPSLAVFLWLLTLLNAEKCKNKRKNGALGRQAELSSLECAQFAKN
ncbi:Uncharacterised protein [Serratia quinivorans]|nr:Uncharacterised protein [Serratia quinivorans]